MRFNILTSSLLIASLGLTACGGDDNNSSSTDHTPPVDNSGPTAPTTNDDVQLSGVVADTNGVALVGVTLQLADQTIVTDNEGKYALTIEDGLEDDDAVLLVKKMGYLTTAREIPLNSAGNYTLNVTLTADQVATLFESSTGVTQPIEAGASVVIPANSIVNADGSDYNGTVNLNANYYNPDSIEGANAFAQPYAGVDQSGENETPIVTVGVIDVKLTDSMGNALNLKEGTTATLNFPEATTAQNLPSIPLWYYDEEALIWVKDGTALRQNDGSYIGQVSHFTLWNLDVPLTILSSALVEGCVVDAQGNTPAQNWTGEVIGRGFANTGTTDNKGDFSIRIPANTPLTLLSSAYDNYTFDNINIPRQDVGAVYQVNNGTCITVNDFDATTVVIAPTFESLPLVPVPTPTPIDNTLPVTEAGLIGYQIDFDYSYSYNTKTLKEVEIETTTVSATQDNTIKYLLSEIVDQPIYGETEYDQKILTPNGISNQVRIYLTQTQQIASDFLSASFTNNTIYQRLDNGSQQTLVMVDVPLSGQKVADIVAMDNYFNTEGYSDAETIIYNRIDSLPASISVLDDTATCKKIASGSNGPLDSIVLDDITFDNQPLEAYLDEFQNPVRGEWAGIPWIASSVADDEDTQYYNALVRYEDKTYEGEYFTAGDITFSEQDKAECTFYNEAAKQQIIEAINRAFPNI